MLRTLCRYYETDSSKGVGPVSPALSVVALADEDAAIKAHFTKTEIQYIGSTSNCGCDFRHLMFQSGCWPAPLQKDSEKAVNDRRNQEALVNVLQVTGEKTIELYGVWNHDFSEPISREEIALQDLLAPDFYFKEQGFYKLKL